MTTVYHVTRTAYDGGDLLPLIDLLDSGAVSMLDAIKAAWFRWDWPTPFARDDMDSEDWLALADSGEWSQYLDCDGRQIHFHADLADAKEFAEEFGGPDSTILAVLIDNIETYEGAEYPHPVTEARVPAEYITIIDSEK